MNGQAWPAVAQTLPQLYCQLAGSGLGDPALRRIRDAGLLAVTRAGHLLRGSGKPFSCHLVGVASLVAESAPGEEILIRAALLHAFYQERVSGADAAHADRQVMRDDCGEEVEPLLYAYQAAGMPEPDMPLPEPLGLARGVRLLQLADQLEDALDGGPWWHGSPDDAGTERGCAQDRVDRFIALSALFEQAPALGAASMLERYRAIRAHWERGVWPDCLRSGRYTSFRPA